MMNDGIFRVGNFLIFATCFTFFLFSLAAIVDLIHEYGF